MRKVQIFLIGIMLLILVGCKRVRYDIRIGTKDFVTVTFRYGKNVKGKQNEVYKIYGVQKGKKIDYEHEPQPPVMYQKGDSFGDVGFYYFKAVWNRYKVGENYNTARYISLSDYTFYKDETIYVDFYEGFERRNFYIVKEDVAKKFYAIDVISGNIEIRSFFTEESDKIVTDFGDYDLKKDNKFLGLRYYMDYFKCEKIIGWYYDEKCTKTITFPFTASRYNNPLFDYYLKVE